MTNPTYVCYNISISLNLSLIQTKNLKSKIKKIKFTNYLWRIKMARIAGVDLPNEKRVEIGLTYIYGVGRVTANKILEATKINPDTRVKDLTENDIGKIREYMDKNLSVEGDKKREVAMDIKALMEIGSYRGVRHRKGLPVRGQSTRSNARTRKGPRNGGAKKK